MPVEGRSVRAEVPSAGQPSAKTEQQRATGKNIMRLRRTNYGCKGDRSKSNSLNGSNSGNFKAKQCNMFTSVKIFFMWPYASVVVAQISSARKSQVQPGA